MHRIRAWESEAARQSGEPVLAEFKTGDWRRHAEALLADLLSEGYTDAVVVARTVEGRLLGEFRRGPLKFCARPSDRGSMSTPYTCEICCRPARAGVTCDACHRERCRQLLASPAWVEVARTRRGDRPGETLADTIAREAR